MTLGRVVRRLLGMVYQVVAHDQLNSMRNETERLAAASVESMTYVSVEIRDLRERLAALEEETAALRRILEEPASPDQRSGGGPGKPDSADRSAGEESLVRPADRA